ncbi:hypothetical protein TV54_32 [Enterococcus phage vB_EFaS_TV54]|nr:hypothetical protein TV54_32 [Enterococcus phage vB_EFaS_TV54]
MKLQDGMLVKRKDNGAKGVAHKMEGGMWKVKYHDGTHTYTTESAFKNHFVIPELEVNFEDSKSDGVKPEQEVNMTYDEYLNQSDDVVTKHLEKEAHKTASDLIDKQDHYTNNGIQPIQIMKANMTKEEFRGFLEGNILKYPLRYKYKNGLEDLKKAKTYLTWLIEDIEERGL